MNKEFKLPDVGEGLTEADIVSWHVKPGDTIEDGQVIVEIETAKAVVELPSPYAGTVTGLLVEEGQTVDVGTPIIAVDVGGTDGAAGKPAAEPATAEPATAEAAAAQAAVQAATEPGATEPEGTVPEAAVPDAPTDAPPARQAVLVGYGVKPGSTSRRARKKPPTRPGSYPPSPAMPGQGGRGTGPTRARPPPKVSPPGASIAKPPVRRLARDLGVDLSALTGSGPEGSVTREDVQQAAGDATVRSGYPAAAPSDERHAAATASQQRTEERIPVRGVRKHIAAAMVASAFTAPHVTEFLQVDVTETMAAVRRARELPEFAEVKVSPLLFVAKALLVAAGRHPMVNSTWDEAAQEIVVKPYVNLGIAVAAERGLLVPNVKGAQALLAGRAGAGARRAGGHGAGGQGHAGRPDGRHDHDHQRGRVRRGRRDAHPDAGRSGDPRLRPGAGRAMGAPGRARGAQGDDAVAVVRPQNRGRRTRLSGAPRRRLNARRSGPDARLVVSVRPGQVGRRSPR